MGKFKKFREECGEKKETDAPGNVVANVAMHSVPKTKKKREPKQGEA